MLGLTLLPCRTHDDVSFTSTHVTQPPSTFLTSPSPHSPLSQVKAVDEDTVIANYLVLVQGGGKPRFWFQLKRDCVLYRFKAHEVREGRGGEGGGRGGREGEGEADEGIVTIFSRRVLQMCQCVHASLLLLATGCSCHRVNPSARL